MCIGIPVYDNGDDFDVAGPLEMFDWAGYEIDLLAEAPGMMQFRSHGVSYQVTRAFDQARTARYMCSVCDGGMLLAASGLLDGYQATAHWQFLSSFPQRFPNVIVAPGFPRFVHDRDRLTGAGVASGLDTALKLIDLLSGVELAQQVQQSTQDYPEPPVSSTLPPIPETCPLPPPQS
jgi:cyclohexyl-isocyanide hydratase